jgi:hypothetical protein
MDSFSQIDPLLTPELVDCTPRIVQVYLIFVRQTQNIPCFCGPLYGLSAAPSHWYQQYPRCLRVVTYQDPENPEVVLKLTPTHEIVQTEGLVSIKYIKL